MCPPHHEAATMAAHKQWSSSATVIFAIEVRPTTCPFPFAYPSLARKRKFSWLSTPTRARHWLATFLGQGCCAACCCKAKKPKLHEPQLGSANWRTESCWMLDATAVAAAAAGCVLSLVLNAVPGAAILSYARFISSISIGISVHTV